ncbi:FKBP-type peptidyl-prolyl cis-trans isomerase [Nitzschia inconspicua]|uniref:peptidylprolyl isomerase n=1 Tax=Nitzschia inconspicua TaxID=303405 RepID=A0A9K3LD62_9STRA|nr:FKBP-type peptidyl-prolyl cis-trans isomerase [Nitzschia inconspicua]
MVEIEAVPQEEEKEEEKKDTVVVETTDKDEEETNETTTTTTPSDTITGNGEWKELMGKDLMMKVVSTNRTAGKEPEPIEPQDAVLVNIEGWIAESHKDDFCMTDKDGNEKDNKKKKLVFQRSKSWLIVVGEGDVLPAIEMGIRFMETGQTALVWSHSKYAMGPGTRTIESVTVPPHSNVMYRIQLLQKVMDTSRLNPYFTIQKALTRKKIANDIYQFEWSSTPATCEQAMNRSIRLYTRAAKDMETLLQGNYFSNVEEDHPQRIESRQLLLDSLNNIVAVHLKQKSYHKAKLAAVDVLQVDPHNLKGLLRAAKASLLDPASTLEEAKAALDAAEADITYKHPDEEQQLQRLKVLFKKKQHQYKTTTRAMFGNKLQNNNNNNNNNANKSKEDTENTENDDDKDDVPNSSSTTTERRNKTNKNNSDATTTTTTTTTTTLTPGSTV